MLNTQLTYNNTNHIQPYIIGNNALNINIQNIYTLILRNYERIQEEIKSEINGTLTTKEEILKIQKGFLDLVNEETINIAGTSIKFSNDFWDFSEQYKEGKIILCYRYYFTGKQNQYAISDYYKIVLKLFVFYLITEFGLDHSSNSIKFTHIRKLLEYLTKNNITTLEQLSLDELKQIYESKNILYTTAYKSKVDIKVFYTFYSLLIKDVYKQDFADYFNDRDSNTIKAITEENKASLLPTLFYKNYSNLLFEYAMNESNNNKDRGLAGLLFIGTQTGLRGGELTILEENCIEEMKYKNKKVGILHYRSTKNGTKNKTYKNGETNANSKVIDIVNKLRPLFNEARVGKKTSLLIVNVNSKHNCNQIRASFAEEILHKFNIRFCIMNYKKLGILNNEESDMFGSNIDGTYIQKHHKKFLKSQGIKPGDKFSIPTITQFRVYFASELRERGVDDRTVSFLLNHNSEEMWGYYARPKNEIQEDIDFTKEILSNILQDNTKILGAKGDALRNKIDNIIKENNFNLEIDLDSIIDKVRGEVPIRKKEGGFCMKSNPRRECRHDAETDEFLCAYGCCPNHCHMYFMITVTYNKYLDVKKLIKYNQENGYINQAQKEAFKLESIINQELAPEIIELQNEIDRKGKDLVLEKHPNLIYIISHYTEIKEDIELWKKKIQAMNY